ncbi:uncharacterized protein LOC107616654 isoform X1 [Arachis ipaensis]|uniref:Uncharacterized protein n=2 Tax=Arachis hypogaea TaxID=3818 RepID=A0A444XCU8_ARAHY|nr:uncharacterized protein LOC107616654 isoform X1 [Arachis ipaensis]XP_016174095.1 uncharacterized protein LOC107616654 isoform X1 [Arachis ipaensis]XP_025679886.1 uncharacterized protein LOC112779763 isoform X1 [Arachis hypogaea]XP_025679887.1 uncharacterized protein LOC112779763 isoform X1 [Arachis hypogaea]QHN75765.1 uncharacterized protein DS421_19g638120 [Arachis hypogaea]QHN75766.1 uncharacterized protein DS421_19g638120 [Arachis hypogaea]RYQ87313.1 hypothetical protein Ahy_B09g094796 
MDDQTLRNKKEKIIAMFIVQLHMLNCLTMKVLITCLELVVEHFKKKNKRRKLNRSSQIAMASDSDSDSDSSVGEVEAEHEADSQVPEIENTSQDDTASSAFTIQANKKRKRANNGDVNVLNTVNETINMIHSSQEQLANAVSEFISCFKLEKERSERAQNLNSLLKGIDGLNVEQRMRAAVTIVMNKNLLDSIFTVAPEDRSEFVSVILNQSS